ncbi:MAG TPA: hypothetical protein VFI24_15415 [Pyrinomonadaceae bacterium]|nr:hypothetical protein [Pyrinomonadaceae bacterium]
MKSKRLSAIDAFFVAYQESSGVLMQLGVELELKGRIDRENLEAMLSYLVRRWPPLGQRVDKPFFGLEWDGPPRVREMLHVGETREGLHGWRNKTLNPFVEPPFQVLWIANGDEHVLAFRAHHAVVDGEGFIGVCAEALRALAAKNEGATDCADRGGSPKRISVSEALGNVQKLREQARSNKSARLAVRSCSPGEIAVIEREVNVANGWLCAAAWMKAIYEWNCLRGSRTPSLISLEVPVSLRRRRDTGLQIGNLISPLTLFGDATQPLEQLATQLKQQMSRALRQQEHLALPTLAAPGDFIPWEVFRRIASSPELTGFATSHFAWLEHEQTIHDDVFRLSNGALQLVDQQVYTPVCLHMGAALAVLAWPERTQAFLPYRLTALDENEANTLLDLVAQQLKINSTAAEATVGAALRGRPSVNSNGGGQGGPPLQ